MAAKSVFASFDTYKLTEVKVTDQELGHGSYATVIELEYMGLKCAGKKIHDVLLRQGDASYSVLRFEEECRLLSQIRHPNIVQFLGVYFQEGAQAPILVMELLPTNLTNCIKQYGIFPEEISYSILHDVAVALHYLHGQTPPILHRDLSSNNVLLTSNMKAKISDLGVARILNLTPLQVSCMTQTPGTPAYMPPEVMTANPQYDTSIDIFSYGILIIHILSGRWPEPQVGPNRFESNQLIPVSECERRGVFLHAIGHSHPLMDLILRCISNDAGGRGHTSDIVKEVATLKSQYPASFSNRLEELKNKKQQEGKIDLAKEVGDQNQQLEKKLVAKDKEIARLNLLHLCEFQELKLQVRDLVSKNKYLIAKSEADAREFRQMVSAYNTEIITNERSRKQTAQEARLQIAKERESAMELRKENQELQKNISQLKIDVISFKKNISSAEAEIAKNESEIEKKDAELDLKTRALEEKDSIISDMSRHLSSLGAHFKVNKQVG